VGKGKTEAVRGSGGRGIASKGWGREKGAGRVVMGVRGGWGKGAGERVKYKGKLKQTP
jgi:hypothetical protein